MRCGLRSALIRHILSHDKISRIVILFFQGQAKKYHAVIRDLFVVNRDKKSQDFSLQKRSRVFFLRYGRPYLPVLL